MTPGWRAAVVVASDRAARGERADATGPAVARLLAAAGAAVTGVEVLPDDAAALAAALRRLSAEGADLVVVAGGTGLGPRDVTPEAIRAVADRELPGLGELMRQAGRAHTPNAALSRCLGAARGRTLLLGVPGSPAGACQSLEAVLPLVGHARHMLAGGDHPQTGAQRPEREAPPAGEAPREEPAPGHRAPPAGPPVVAVVGWSGSGKTTLVTGLVAELSRRGYRVATVKHHHRPDVTGDEPGKDTWEHARAGAAVVALAGPGLLALRWSPAAEPDPDAVARLVAAAAPVDLIIAEGYKEGPFPKIAVQRGGAAPPVPPDDPLLLAVVAEEPVPASVPRFAPADLAALCDLLAQRLLHRPAQ